MRLNKLEERLRNGDQAALADAQRMIQSGQLAPSDAQPIIKTSQTPRLVSSIRSLPMFSTLEVWDAATDQERQQLGPTMIRKMAAFRKLEYQKLTPVERERVDVRLAKVFHDLTAAQP
jgi:hypothetical protein